MNNYKPYSYLYKDERLAQKTLTTYFISQVPAGKKLAFNNIIDDSQNKVFILSYDIVDNTASEDIHQEEHYKTFNWDGSSYEVKIIIGSGRGGDGGTVITHSDGAE
jgi:hypothetical protein